MEAIKKGTYTLLGLAALGFLVFGGRGAEERHEGRVVVTYWEKWTGKEAEQMQQIVDDFNRTVGKEKGIYVRYLSMSSVDQKTLVATAAGVPPDVAGLWDPQVSQFAEINALEPLDDLAAAHGIDANYYKPVYWNACHYKGRLWALISTPAAVALHYNRRIFQQQAAKLRQAGLDPNRPPRSLQELDRYAMALDDIEKLPNGKTRIQRSGYLPSEPGWYLNFIPYWFGGDMFDARTGKITLTTPQMIKSFEWIKSYSVRLGKDSMTEFTSGLGNFDSPQNAFLSGTVAMEQQGPWMANYIRTLKPSMLHWKGTPEEEYQLPIEQRRALYDWAAAPFPSAVPGLEDVTYAGFDVLMIPRGAKHRREAFEFIAYVNRQDVSEKLNALHCKNSPLRQVSEHFIHTHPNPYIEVFEHLAASKNAHSVPHIPIWPEINSELSATAQSVSLLQMEPKAALEQAQTRLQEKYDTFMLRQRLRHQGGS